MKRKIILGILILFIAAQFLQPTKNQGNPSAPRDILQTVSVPDNVLSILKRSCYDCHSNYTVYPWYDHITPVNWWIKTHIDEGKNELNFTIFGTYEKDVQLHVLKEISQTIKTDEMPLKSYLLMHSHAKLTQTEKQLIVAWAQEASDELLGRRVP